MGEGDGNPLQYSCLENPMDGGAWSAGQRRPHLGLCPGPNVPLQGPQGSQVCIPDSPRESGLVSKGSKELHCPFESRWVSLGAHCVATTPPMTSSLLSRQDCLPRDPRRDSRGERSPWIPLETRPDSPGAPRGGPRLQGSSGGASSDPVGLPILNPPPSSLPIPSLWVVPVH